MFEVRAGWRMCLSVAPGSLGVGPAAGWPPQPCPSPARPDAFPSLPLCFLPHGVALCASHSGRRLPSWCSPAAAPAVLFSLIAAGEFSGFQSLLESALMGGGNSQVGLVSLSLSPSRIWGFDKYPYSEMERVASGMFLSEVSVLEGLSHLGPPPPFSRVKTSVLRGVDLRDCLGCLVVKLLIY